MGVRTVSRHRPATRHLRGLGDVLQDAANKLAQAGYPNASCYNQVVTSPGGSYVNPVCSVPGYSEGFQASATVGLSIEQIRNEMQAQVQRSAAASGGYAASPTGGQTPGSTLGPATVWQPVSYSATPAAPVPTVPTVTPTWGTQAPTTTVNVSPSTTRESVTDPLNSTATSTATSSTAPSSGSKATTDQLLSTSQPFSWQNLETDLPQSVQDVLNRAGSIAPWYLWAGGAAVLGYFIFSAHKGRR